LIKQIFAHSFIPLVGNQILKTAQLDANTNFAHSFFHCLKREKCSQFDAKENLCS
jgi:hypothetical protein